MAVLIFNLLIIFALLKLIISQESIDPANDGVKYCRERNRLVDTEKNDFYKIIDATLYEKLILQCHFCDENDDGRPKNWYNSKPGISTPREVGLGMETDYEKNRVRVTLEHSLIIENFTKADSGLYYCVSFEERSVKEKLNFLIDIVYGDNITPFETGSIIAWSQYHSDQFSHINNLLEKSDGVEFAYIRKKLQIKMELITQWEPWGFCEICGRPEGEGIQKRIGLCRIKISPTTIFNQSSLNSDEKYLLNVTAISCRSQILGSLFPGLSNLTRIIPHFKQTQSCEGSCNPDVEGVNRGWKVGKSKGFKYRKTVTLREFSHLTLICPESNLDSKVIWRRNGKVLPSGERVQPQNPNEEPRIIVDTFSTLYLIDVRDTEAGNYTCQVDDIRMQQIVVFVASKSRLLTHAIVRHFMYLGFILALTTTCYCAGLIITCNRRRSFDSYEELKEKNAKKADPEELQNLI